MNAAQVIDHFDRICDAPDAIPRLRRFILDLAVRGKLVEQDPNDEPASELLKRIETERTRPVKKGDVKNKDLIVLVSSDEVWPVPANWTFVPLEVLAMPSGLFTDGDWVESKDQDPNGDIRLTQLADVGIGEFRNRSSRFMNAATAERLDCTFLKEGDILIARMPDPLGRACIFPGDPKPAVTVVDVAVLRLGCRDFDAAYVVHAINSPQFARNVESKAAGTTRSRISRGNLSVIPFPLPPLAEQHRIVAKVDELMALCDRLEAAQGDRESRRDKLVASSLHRLNNGADPDEFREHARFHFHYLPRLTTRPEHIQQLRQTILNLAVRGKLVPQDPNDEPAAELLKRIQTEKERLLRDGRSHLKLHLPAIVDSETPFKLPTSWTWVRLGELVTDAEAGWSPKSEGFPRSGENWGVLKVSAVSWDKFLPEENKQLLPGITPPEAAQVHAGDFLISRANTSELVAKCVVVEQQPSRLILSDKVVRLQIVEGCIKKFLSLVNNNAPHARAYYAEEASGTSLSMKNVSRAVIYALLVPLAPLSEQRRIVAKVDELMGLCDRLEAQLTTSQTGSRRLLEATLDEALNARL